MQSSFFFIVVVLLFSSCRIQDQVVKSEGQSAAAPIDTSSLPVRWPGNKISGVSLNVAIAQDLIDDFGAADIDDDGRNPVEQMAKVWDNGAGNVTFFTQPFPAVTNIDTGDLNSYNDGVLGVYRSDIWFNEVSSSALAITQFFGHRRHIGTPAEHLEIIHADVIFNYRDFTFSTSGGSGFDYDFQSVILHELGHFLGLPHHYDYDSASVMEPYLSLFDTKRAILDADIAAIRGLYPDNLQSSGERGQMAARASSRDTAETEVDSTVYRGVFELRENGNCIHYIDGKKVKEHKVNSAQFKR